MGQYYLTKTALRPPFRPPVLILTRQTSVKDVEDYVKLVRKCLQEWSQAEINSSKLYLLHGHCEHQRTKTCASHFMHTALFDHGENSRTSRGNYLDYALHSPVSR